MINWMRYIQEPTHLDQIDTLSRQVEKLSLFIHQLGKDPVEAYASDTRRSCSGSSGADNHVAGPSTSYRPNIDFGARGPSYEDLRRVGRFDDTSSYLD